MGPLHKNCLAFFANFINYNFISILIQAISDGYYLNKRILKMIKFYSAISKKDFSFLALGITLLCLYFFWENRLGSFHFTHYVHQYRLNIKDLILLAPGLFIAALFISKMIPGGILTKPFNWVMNLQTGILLLSVFLLFTALTGMISIFVFEGIPHIQDCIAQFFQAKIFSTGKVALVPPNQGQFFDVQYIINDGKSWHGKYFFGQSLFLLLGILIKIPWIINPILGGASLVLTYYLAKEMFDEKTSRLAILAALTSPFFIFMSASYMSHVSNLFFITLCLLCTLRSFRVRKWYYPFLAGLSIGLAFNNRPFSALLIVLPFCGYALIALYKRLIQTKEIILFCLPALILLFSFFYYNYLFTGDPFTTMYTKYDPNSGLGFGPEKGEFSHFADGGIPGHTFRKAIYNTAKYFIALNADLFGWPSLSLLFIFILFLSLTKNKWDYLLLASIISIAVGYFFYWGLGISLGARYFFECLPMLLILSVRGFQKTAAILNKYFFSKQNLFKQIDAGQAVGLFVFFLCMLNFTVYFPSRIKIYSDSYWNVDSDIYNQTVKRGLKNALVFVESQTYRKPHTDPDYYNAAFIYNSLNLDGPVVYARDLGMPENAKLMAQYPTRKYYLFKKTGRMEKGSLVKIEAKTP